MTSTSNAPSWTLTWFRHMRDSRRGLRVTYGPDELAHALADAGPHVAAKSDLPLLCLATFDGDHRGNERVERVHMLGLDVDEPQVAPRIYSAAISSTLGGVEVFAYSTSSSLPGAYKLRALVPYDRPGTADEHRASWSLVARVLSRSRIVVDRACSDPARGFYIWAVPSSGAYFHAHISGDPWPVGRAAEVEAACRAAEARPVAPRPWTVSRADVVERARRYVATMPTAISGSGGHAATFAVARRLVADFGLDDAAAWDLLVEYNGRCKPAWSQRELRHKLASARTARVRVPMGAP